MTGPQSLSMDVDGLHNTGGTISNRSSDSGAAGRGLLTGLEDIAGNIGIPAVKNGLTNFNTVNVLDQANKAGTQVDTAGGNVRYTAAFHRDQDNENGTNEQSNVVENVELKRSINTTGTVQL